ncbi:thioesterase protein (plasmid) [Streptantibioticus cattleyicolor NRRL 8057 = DSM 46488]|uniref:Thioesterase protein n=1 Tax=Streptantibioticus cattleyicolor (strain ATCC 35852 / DSM 46488 / JCM 4925 / NBRC 14057 / NRRL 8057) TaxID=1003195 RepID=F8JJV3_STREN|nr:thioesterase protein [Streptantibioticus cattleyicolor NRRL 8057 = DSM 46488]CCB72320.1 Thioesterase superfamily protein [Streptantibioticus cattleyicolor NRRL 8057 = DSM 46488]
MPFSDVDMHGHVHNGVYFAYVETALNEFLRLGGLSGRFDPRHNDVVYHVRKAELVYHAPAGFEDELDVTPRVARIGDSSLTFAVAVTRAGDGTPVADATVVWVCVDRATGRTTPVPDATRAALAATAGEDR